MGAYVVRTVAKPAVLQSRSRPTGLAPFIRLVSTYLDAIDPGYDRLCREMRRGFPTNMAEIHFEPCRQASIGTVVIFASTSRWWTCNSAGRSPVITHSQHQICCYFVLCQLGRGLLRDYSSSHPRWPGLTLHRLCNQHIYSIRSPASPGWEFIGANVEPSVTRPAGVFEPGQ